MQTFVRIAGLLADHRSWGFRNAKQETHPLGKEFRTNDFFKVNLCPCMSIKHVGRGYTNPLILNLGNDGHEWSASRPGRFFRPWYPLNRKISGPIAGLELWKRKKMSFASGKRNMLCRNPDASLVTTTVLSILSAELRTTQFYLYHDSACVLKEA